MTEPTTFEELLRAHEADPANPDLFERVLEGAARDFDAAKAAMSVRMEPGPALSTAPPRAWVLPAEIPSPAAETEKSAPAQGPYAAPPARPSPLTNWGGNIVLGGSQARQPVNSGQARSTLSLAVAGGLPARGIGASHSSSIVLQTNGVLVDSGTLTTPESSATNSMLRQCRELAPQTWYSLDAGAAARHVEVGSGARFQDVLDYLASSSRALPMTGSYTGQTLVGAFMTSTHGAGVQHPPLQAAARSIQMLVVTASGAPEEVRIERTKGITDPAAYTRDNPQVKLIQDDEVFLAAVVSMGSMGFVLSVIIETVEPYYLYQESMLTTWPSARGMLLDTGPDGIPTYFKDTYNGGVLLSPYPVGLSYGGPQLAFLSRTYLRPDKPEGAGSPTSSSMSELLIRIFRALSNVAPALVPALINYSISQQSTAPLWGPGNQMTGSDAELPQGFSAEHGFPASAIVPAMDAILAQMADLAGKKKMLVGPISLRYVGATDALLSMTQGGNRCFAEVLTLAGAGSGSEVLAAIEPTALDNGSRPHWGQWFSAAAVPRIAASYPEYARWKAVRERLDPTGLFRNAFTAALP